MKRTNYPVLTVPAAHFNHLQEICKGSTGPKPSIYGMRKLYWGADAPIIKCCNHAFLVDREVYHGYKIYAR